MTSIRIHNPCNEHTRYYRNYNLFWDKFTDKLKENFEIVEENRYFKYSHMQRYPVKLQGGISHDFQLLECEYVIENINNNEFVIMSVSDDITHACVNERHNPLMKKTLIAQYCPKRLLNHLDELCEDKILPWTYFQSSIMDLEPFYKKRLENIPENNSLYFKGTSLEDRSILFHIDKNIITEFNPIPPESYFDEIIKHKIALSIDGRGEFCYRDIECFAIGVPILRFEFLSKFNDPLIPNYHYISIPRPNDMDLYRTGNETHAKMIEKRYHEVLNNDNFLNFISKNAREYYEKNCTMGVNIDNTFRLLQLENWL
jgi:hypothetical protein